MKPSSIGAALFWQEVLFWSYPILASPRISPELAPSQTVVSSTSSPSVSVSAGIYHATHSSTGTGKTASTTTSESDNGDSTTVPMVNSPLLFPSFSECTSGDTGTATFTSEFAHHTGFETIAEDQEFWNDTGAVWAVKIVSPGYSIQELGLFNGGNSDWVDSTAISIGSASSTFVITVPTHGCLSTCILLNVNLSNFTITPMKHSYR